MRARFGTNKNHAQLPDEQLAQLVDAAMAHLPAPAVAGEERSMTFECFCAEFQHASGIADIPLRVKVPTY